MSEDSLMAIESLGRRYQYMGPASLGSIVSHYCHALRMESSKDSYDWQMMAYEVQGKYFLVVRKVSCQPMGSKGISLSCLCREYQQKEEEMRMLTFMDEATPEGRATIGRMLYAFLVEELGETMSDWGDLVGVRPVKYYHKKKALLGSEEAVLHHLVKERHVSPLKADLLAKVGRVQERFIHKVVPRDRRISLYGNIPFCTSHCTYCSFPYRIIQKEEPMDDWTDSFLQDIASAKKGIETYNLDIHSAYLGGGTPTALSEKNFAQVVQAIGALLKKGTEFTVEAGRPDTLTEGKLQAMVEAGVTRISINPQTMQEELLRRIGRGHTVQDVLSLFNRVRATTNFVINMDFIAGLPGQTRAHMEENLSYITKLRPDNVTIHTLALKKGSPLFNSALREEISSVEEVRVMVEMAQEFLTKMGYVSYYLYRQQLMTGSFENVGYCLPETECIYNIMMMEERQPILSVGPGSTTKWMVDTNFTQMKQYMPKDVPTYIRELKYLLEKRERQMKECYGEV